MYLLDTNIWLERLLEQEESESVGQFLELIPAHTLIVTDFTLHSIGLILTRLNQPKVLLQFVQDVFTEGSVNLIALPVNELARLVAIMDEFKLDFDDAYQYAVAERENAVLVSFDQDFDRTERKRRTPEQILTKLSSDADVRDE